MNYPKDSTLSALGKRILSTPFTTPLSEESLARQPAIEQAALDNRLRGARVAPGLHRVFLVQNYIGGTIRTFCSVHRDVFLACRIADLLTHKLGRFRLQRVRELEPKDFNYTAAQAAADYEASPELRKIVDEIFEHLRSIGALVESNPAQPQPKPQPQPRKPKSPLPASSFDALVGTENAFQLQAHLDRLTITSENIDDIRRSLFLAWDGYWNGLVRSETAARERPIEPDIQPTQPQPQSQSESAPAPTGAAELRAQAARVFNGRKPIPTGKQRAEYERLIAEAEAIDLRETEKRHRVTGSV